MERDLYVGTLATAESALKHLGWHWALWPHPGLYSEVKGASPSLLSTTPSPLLATGQFPILLEVDILLTTAKIGMCSMQAKSGLLSSII